jgi:hypothetical protein
LHWGSHSHISGASRDEVKAALTNARIDALKSLKKASWIIVTTGTAWVYRLLSEDILVANCHKIPQKQFKKELLSVSQIVDQFSLVHTQINLINPSLNWLFTVSPVRHVKDGLIENNLSKSVILQATHQLVESHTNCHYFPSYELVIDVLRDYRFYERDLIHPNELAIDYLWGNLKTSWFSTETTNTVNQIDEIKSALSHRPFNPESEQHQSFLRKTLEKAQQLHGHVNLANEIDQLQKLLNNAS